MRRFILPALLLLAASARPRPAAAAERLDHLADLALSEKPETAEPAIATLRAAGPAGLDALLQRRPADVAGLRDSLEGHAELTPRQRQLRAVLDRVARQRDAFSAGLYWYTDFDQARAAAAASGRPILSLRLLGNLDEELSCANSRYFRTVLYADAGVSAWLRGHFILHWQSVRPAPRLIVDYGDGRAIERTITGNSLHYVLAADGAPVDALPGLYGPGAFLRLLQNAETAARETATLDGAVRIEALRRFHADRVASLEAAWPVEALRAGRPGNARPAVAGAPAAPDGITAGRIAVGKREVEMPAVRAMVPLAPPEDRNDALWSRIAVLHADDARLDPGSLRMMRIKSATPPPVAPFERAIALDSVRNEYLLHLALDRWFVAGEVPTPLGEFTKKIYAELFLTPDSDPWLGLAPADAYAAIENGGLFVSATAGSNGTQGVMLEGAVSSRP